MRKRLSVLVFGDSAPLCAGIVEMLKEFEVDSVRTASSAAEVARLLSGRSYDFVLVGGLGGGGAEDMIRAVRHSSAKSNRDLPVIAALNAPNERSIEVAKIAGADNVLCAPISWRALAEAIAHKAGRRRCDFSSPHSVWPKWESEQVYWQ